MREARLVKHPGIATRHCLCWKTKTCQAQQEIAPTNLRTNRLLFSLQKTAISAADKKSKNRVSEENAHFISSPLGKGNRHQPGVQEVKHQTKDSSRKNGAALCCIIDEPRNDDGVNLRDQQVDQTNNRQRHDNSRRHCSAHHDGRKERNARPGTAPWDNQEDQTGNKSGSQSSAQLKTAVILGLEQSRGFEPPYHS
jgi:hypothetical protein